MPYDLAVAGGGIVGLAVAREALRRTPGARVVVLEAAPSPAGAQTAANSGVVHAGIYYAAGSLKARLCVEGKRALDAYCAARGVPYRKLGKAIVALDRSELPALDELERRGRANGVPGLRRIDGAELRELEPAAAGIAALHSPHTAVVNFAAVAAAYAEDVVAAGGEIRVASPVARLAEDGPGVRVHLRDGEELRATQVIACAGAGADRLAVASGAPADPRIVAFRGAYLRLRPGRTALVRGLIYPVPDPSLPFLGVHFTRRLDGEVLVGPTALLQPSARALAWPGTRRLARRWWRTGVRELRWAASRAGYAREAARYVPGLEAHDLEDAFAGTRAQALARDGTLVDDFAVSRTGRVLHVRNAPSPAATSSLALARLICDEAGYLHSSES